MQVNIRPQCNPLGYESETYAIVDVEIGGTYYQFYNVALIDHRDEHGMVDRVTVCVTDDDNLDPDNAETVGYFHVLPSGDEHLYELALANFLLNDSRSESIPCDVS